VLGFRVKIVKRREESRKGVGETEKKKEALQEEAEARARKQEEGAVKFKMLFVELKRETEKKTDTKDTKST
jgi:hypothetical protein